MCWLVFVGKKIGRRHRHICSLIEANIKIEVGNGRHTRFWQDTWILTSKDKISDLNSFTSNKDNLVSDCWNTSCWCISFRRNFFIGRIPGMSLLLEDLNLVALSGEVLTLLSGSGKEWQLLCLFFYKTINSRGSPFS